MAKILGISAYYHDAAACLCVGGVPVAAAQEERFTRIKHTPDFPEHAIRYCLQEAGLGLSDLDAVVFYDKPLLKFERLLQTYYSHAPRGLRSFLKSMPVWLGDKLFLKKLIREGLERVEPGYESRPRLLFSEHHLSHAGSAFYPSGFGDAAILTVDGVGEWCTASISHGTGKEIRMLRELHFPHSVGLLYSAFTWYLGFTVNSGEYKLMGLAPYADPESQEVAAFEALIREKLVRLYPDGSIWLNPEYFSYATGLKMLPQKRWTQLFGVPARREDEPLTLQHANLALAIQRVTEDVVLHMAAEARRLTGSTRICLAGGVALNCVANGKLQRSGLFTEIFIQPAAGDAGGALGAALAAGHIHFAEERKQGELMQGALLGPEAEAGFATDLEQEFGAVGRRFDKPEDMVREAAALLGDGAVLGWFQGRMEFGPRALGSRSILADPRDPGMQKRLNLAIKQREGFRPFAPAVLKEQASSYFELNTDSPYMLLTAPLREEFRCSLPAGFEGLSPESKLKTPVSLFPAVTHVDFSARVQTVDAAVQPRFHALLSQFYKLTGCPMLVNTSFNVRGEPPVCSVRDAWYGFMATGMDVLVIENMLYLKKDQPGCDDPQRWSRVFKKD